MRTISALTIVFTLLERNSIDPGFGCLITIISTFIDRMLFTVSISVSPFLTDDEEEQNSQHPDKFFSNFK